MCDSHSVHFIGKVSRSDREFMMRRLRVSVVCKENLCYSGILPSDLSLNFLTNQSALKNSQSVYAKILLLGAGSSNRYCSA